MDNIRELRYKHANYIISMNNIIQRKINEDFIMNVSNKLKLLRMIKNNNRILHVYYNGIKMYKNKLNYIIDKRINQKSKYKKKIHEYVNRIKEYENLNQYSNYLKLN